MKWLEKNRGGGGGRGLDEVNKTNNTASIKQGKNASISIVIKLISRSTHIPTILYEKRGNYWCRFVGGCRCLGSLGQDKMAATICSCCKQAARRLPLPNWSLHPSWIPSPSSLLLLRHIPLWFWANCQLNSVFVTVSLNCSALIFK